MNSISRLFLDSSFALRDATIDKIKTFNKTMKKISTINAYILLPATALCAIKAPRLPEAFNLSVRSRSCAFSFFFRHHLFQNL